MTRGVVWLTTADDPPSWLPDIVSIDSVSEAPFRADVPFDLHDATVWARVEGSVHGAQVLRTLQRGADVVLRLAMDEPQRSAFLDEVRRVAAHVSDLQPPQLDTDQRELVRLLREGVSLRDAAERLHMSNRTADRRLAQVRTVLGVTTTAEVLRMLPGD